MPEFHFVTLEVVINNAGNVQLSVFEYQYRDASNYKKARSILVSGRAEQKHTDAILSSLKDSEFFIPECVGLPSLQYLFEPSSVVPNTDDHVWHEFIGLTAFVNQRPHDDRTDLSVCDLAAAFLEAQWDENESLLYPTLASQIVQGW